MQRTPILVTGAHRSGTTWVGRVLALAPGVTYIHEPFNPVTPVGICGAPFRRFFEYVCDENAARYEPALARTLELRYDVRRQARTVRSPREAVRSVQDAWHFAVARRRRARPLVKDPIAIFSSEWLAARFGMDVVLLVRHPAAFAASVLRLGWRHRFASFLEQPLLMERHLRPFEAEIRRYAAEPGDPLEEAALLWRAIYSAIRTFQERHPDWIVVRHEDLSAKPIERYGALYARLGLDFTDGVRRSIAALSDERNPVIARTKHDVRVASAAAAWAWRARLPAADVARLRARVEDVSAYFYGDDEW